MLAVYLFCLVVGGGLLLFSLLAGGDSDADGLHADGDGSPEPHADAWDGALAHDFFSVRALLYFLAGFGATGFLIETGDAAGPEAALLWALAAGLLSASMAGAVYGWLRRSESGLVPADNDHLIGLPARVLLPVLREHRGKVLAVQNGREVELLARLYGSADPDCPRGASVVIVDIDGDTALVTPVSNLPLGTD